MRSRCCENVFFGLRNYLELIACRIPVTKFECVQSDTCSEQKGAEVKFVKFTFIVNKPDRFELDMLEVIEAGDCRDLGVETAAAQLLVIFIHRTVINDLKARRLTPAPLAMNLPHGL